MCLGALSPRYFPPPTAIAATLGEMLAGGALWTEALVTLGRLGAAFLLAAVPAVALGLAMGLWRPVRSALEPSCRCSTRCPRSRSCRCSSSCSAWARRPSS